MSSRLSIALALGLLIAVSATIASGAAGVAPIDPGRVRAQLLECSSGKEPSQRSAVFRGQMHQIPEAAQMRLRFHLKEKIGSSKHWRSVVAYGKPKWRYSKPDVQVLAYRESVLGLKPATRYRMGIEFQWLDTVGKVRAQATATTPVCRQRGKLPNLALREDVHARPGPTAGTYRYSVSLHNNGVVTSPPAEVRLTVDGAEVDVRRFGRLAPRERRRIRFVGPACSGAVAAQLDPADVVREITEHDNAMTSRCSDVFFP